MATAAPGIQQPTIISHPRLGIAWSFIWAALGLHVTDEALTGFLHVYNPTVLAIRERLSWWPMPIFTFDVWLAGLTAGIGILVALTPFAFRNASWLRPIFYFCAIVLCIANGCGHTLATILGQTVSSVHFTRPAPGFYSSPLLLFAGIYAIVQLRRTRKGL